MDAGDLEDFTKNVGNYTETADAFFAGSEGQQKMGIGLANGDWTLVREGIMQENKEAWTNPAFIATFSLSTLHAAAGFTTPKPTQAQANNFDRFVKKLPANAKSSATATPIRGGGYQYSATSPGRVPNSKAIYEKIVNSRGETIRMEKTTIDPQGNTVHIKDKLGK